MSQTRKKVADDRLDPEDVVGMSPSEFLLRLRTVTTADLRAFRAELEDMTRLVAAFIRERINLARRNARWEACGGAHEEEVAREVEARR
jgi:hypothetical protein